MGILMYDSVQKITTSPHAVGGSFYIFWDWCMVGDNSAPARACWPFDGKSQT